MKRIALLSVILIGLLVGTNQVAANKPAASLRMLYASEPFINDVQAAAVSEDGKFYVFHGNTLSIYSKSRDLMAKVDTNFVYYPSHVTVDSQGQVYVIDWHTSQIMKFTSSGEWARSFNTVHPFSVAVMRNGKIVVASPSDGKLIHVYDSSGQKLQSFGDIKLFDSVGGTANNFLNRGKVVVDSSDNIYYVFEYAPVPTVLKFSKNGKFISEFSVEGKAIDTQLGMARNYLSTKPAEEVGGIVIINSAAIDPVTNHLWVCMNGSSRSGIIYEYSPKGKKLNEYGIILSLPSIAPFSLSSVTNIVVWNRSAYILYPNGLYYVSTDKSVPSGEVVFPQEVCAQAQTWPGCSTNCQEGSSPTSRNCKSALQGQIASGLRVVGNSCNSFGPGQGIPPTIPPKPNGGCVATVITCDTNTGETVTHTANLDCNAPKYSCVNGNCTPNANGQYTSLSQCQSACTGGGGELSTCIGYWQGESYCGTQASFASYPSTGCPTGYGFDSTSCCCPDNPFSPILIDVQGNGFNLTDFAGGVTFDLNNDGRTGRVAWTESTSDDAWLALDRNGNGTIDNGAELFGDVTPRPLSNTPNGFSALAEFDKAVNGGNSDGRIDSRDAAFSSLRLWQDANHNGISEAAELHTLPSLSISAIDLDHKTSKRTDQFGNQFRYRAKVYDIRGAQVGRWAWDVFLRAR